MKAALLLGLLGLGGAAAFLLHGKTGLLTTGQSGKAWRVVLLSNVAGVKTYEVFSPAGSFGPHGELSVVRYQQTGSDMGSRKVVGVGAGVPEAMRAAAASDFGLPL